MGTQYAFGQIVTDGLVLCLNASDRNSYVSGSTTWNDVSGLGNNGTLINGPTFNSLNGGSIVFDDVNDYVSLPNGLLSGTGDFTINQWIKTESSERGGTTFGNYPSGNLQIFFGFNYIGMWLNNASTYLGTSPWNTALPEFTTQPVMITASRSGSTTYFYMNGVLKKTGSSSSTIGISTSIFRIGDNTNNTFNEQFKGGIFLTQIYNKFLSQSEILQNYNAYKSRFGIT
jgi:hypothetical protein